METLEIRTHQRTEMVDLTDRVQQSLSRSGLREGLCFVYSPHTTAGVTINEHADPNVARDMLMALNKMVPFEDPDYLHDEGNSAAHVKASLVGSSIMALVAEGRLSLGTWQGIFFCEFDGPRTREVRLHFWNQSPKSRE